MSICEHEQSGAVIVLPTFHDGDKVYEHHLAAARLELDNLGLADATVFDARLHKVG